MLPFCLELGQSADDVFHQNYCAAADQQWMLMINEEMVDEFALLGQKSKTQLGVGEMGKTSQNIWESKKAPKVLFVLLCPKIGQKVKRNCLAKNGEINYITCSTLLQSCLPAPKLNWFRDRPFSCCNNKKSIKTEEVAAAAGDCVISLFSPSQLQSPSKRERATG